MNTTLDRAFTIENCGNGGTLTGGVTVAAPFSIVSGGSFNLEVGQSQPVTVRFSPTGAGAASGSATINSNGGSATVNLTGTGTAGALGVSPPTLSFGDVPVGGSKTADFSVTNNNAIPVTVAVSSQAPFSIEDPSSLSLTPGRSREFRVRFSPTAVGAVTGSATITSNGGGATVALGGAGVNESPGTFALTVTREGNGSGTITSSPAGINCGDDCSEAYAANTIVTLTAVPDEGSTFGGWGDDDCSPNGQVTMTTDRTCTAIFDLTLPSPPMTITATLPEFSGEGAVTVGTFSYIIPEGRSIVAATVSGTFGNSIVSNSAPVDVSLDSVLVAQCSNEALCTSTQSTEPWSFTFNPSNFSLLADGSAELTAVQTAPDTIRLGSLMLTITFQ